MSAYLARLKQIDTDSFINTAYTEPTKPTKPTKEAFDGFVGEGMGRIVKNNNDIEINNLNNDSEKFTIGEPTKPTKGYEEIVSNWWLIHFVDRDTLQVAIWPPCNHADALALNPQASAAEPINMAINDEVF
ncbi:MAG TPA: hypothetical protein VIO39_03755 [Methylotenera sp.]